MNEKFPVTNTVYGSLPPYVEGEVSFYLTLKVDQVLWKKKAPGDVTVLVRWWGENRIPVFKPRDVKKNSKSSPTQFFVYKIKTKINLFEAYLGDGEHLELFIVEDNTNEVIGVGKIKNLKRIVYENPYQIYVPVLNSAGRIADVHVCFQLYDSDPLDKQLLHLGCKPLTTGKSKLVFDFSLRDEKQCLQTDRRSEKLKSTTYWPCYSSVNNSANKTVNIPQPVKTVSSNDILLKVLDQSVKLRNAMVKSILEDEDLFMRRTTMTGNSTQPRNTRETVGKPGGTAGVVIDTNKTVMDYLLGDVLNLNGSRHQEISKNMSPISSAIELMEKPLNVDSSSESENIQAVQEEVMTFDGTSSSEQHKNQVHLVSEKNIKLCRKKQLVSGETAVDSPHIETCTNRIRWLRVDVCQLVLKQDNLLKILGSSFLPKASFFAEFELPRDLVWPCKTKQQKPWNSQTHRFCSRKQLNNVVHFDKSISCRIQASNNDTFQKIKSSKLTFSVYFRHMKRQSPVLIGASDLSLHDILKPDEPCKYEVPVHSKIQYSDSSLVVGILNVVIEAMSSKEALKSAGVHNGFSIEQQLRNDPQILQQHTQLSEEKALQFPSEVTNRNCSQVAAGKTLPVEQEFINSSSKITANRRNIGSEKVPLCILLCIQEGCGFKCNSTYLVNRLLWGDKMSRSQTCCGTETPKYNFKEILPVHSDGTFLQRCYNNTLVTEVWCDGKLLGLAHLPLQKFYSAFSDLNFREKVLNEKLPVIGVDGWVDIVDPVSGLKAGQLLVFLAAGTEIQIKAFDSTMCPKVYETYDYKMSDCQQLYKKRNTNSGDQTVQKRWLEKHIYNSQNSPSKNILQQAPDITRITDATNTEYSNISEENCVYKKAILSEMKPTKDSSHLNDLTNKGAESQGYSSDIEKNDILLTNACESNESTTESSDFQVKNKSSKETLEEEKASFGRNHKIYERSPCQKSHQSQTIVKPKPSKHSKEKVDSFVFPECVSPVSSDIEISLSQTSQFANTGKRKSEYTHDYFLSSDINDITSAEGEKEKCSSNETASTGTSSAQLSGVCSTSKEETRHAAETKNHQSCFHAHIEVLSALHLPLVKRNRKRIQPSCYVTFDTSVPRSHGGSSKQLATPVAWYTTSPNWDWSCDTWLSAELLKDKKKMLIFKIWMKAESTERDKHNLLGCVSVDLTVLLFGMPWISGWFNIMDFTGNNKGQIKINITPIESLTRFSIQQLSEENEKFPLLQEAASFFDVSDISHVPSRHTQKGSAAANKNKREANSIQSGEYSVGNTNKKTPADIVASSSDDLADISSFLSSALKSKLLELDEITQRLKSRLNSVTQDEDFSNDPNIGLEDIIREEHKSWDNCEQPSVENYSLGEQCHEKVTPGFAEEVMSNPTIKKYPICNMAAEEDNSHEQNKNTHSKHIPGNQLDIDYHKTVNKMAALSFDKSKDNDNYVNDFDCLTSYFKDIANKDVELENVFNPLLFQQLLSFSDPQPVLHKGTEKFSEHMCCDDADNELSSNKNEEKELVLKVGSDMNDESKRGTSSERFHKLLTNTSNLDVGIISMGKKASSGNFSLDSDCRTNRKVGTHSENVSGIDSHRRSFALENIPFVRSSQSKTESTSRRDCTLKMDSSLHGGGLFDAEDSCNSSESNVSGHDVLRLAPEGGNPTENSTHNLQNISADKGA